MLFKNQPAVDPLYSQIKLTAPNTIGGISSVATYAFASGSNNQLQINWTKPTNMDYTINIKEVVL